MISLILLVVTSFEHALISLAHWVYLVKVYVKDGFQLKSRFFGGRAPQEPSFPCAPFQKSAKDIPWM